MIGLIQLLSALGSLLTLALLAVKYKGEAGDAQTKTAVLDANHTMLAQQNAELAAKAKEQEAKLNDLAAEIIDQAIKTPVAGSFDRLLAHFGLAKKAADSAGASSSAVLHAGPTSGSNPDGLLDPRRE